ncbi:RE1, partial [Symbiodinium microadriaticum]
AAVSLDKTWFDHLLAYCESGMSPEALLAVDGAPFFEGVPRQALQGLVEAVPFTNGWDALKGLVHLNRKARKRLWESSQWVVHLYAGKRPNEEILFLERQGFVVLELDIERGKSHDVNNPLVWRALEWGARHGRIASVIGGPPQNSFMLRRSMTPGPEALRSEDYPYGGWEGQPAAEVDYVNKHTGYFAKMIYLHALATAGRCKFPPDPADVREVGFMLEQPRDPRGYLLFTDPLYQDARSFWRTPMWFYYAEEAGLSTYSFDMSSLGKKLVRHTTIGTNLPLRHLDGLRGRTQLDPFPPEAAPPSVWSREFSENVAIAVRAQRQTPRMLKMSTDQWREHVRRGHLPYRSDCLTCVMAGATGRRHARVEHPSCFTMSADVSGPLKVPGLDADARGAFPRPHKYLFVAKVRIPKTFVDDGRGTFIEYDPGELEEEGPKEEGSFDFQEESPQGDDPVLPQENEADQEEDDEEVEKASKGDPQRYEDDLDMTGPELVNLVFAAAIPDNKSTTVLEMIQDVILYCSALNIPVFRFHCDRGMEFYAKATRQWLKYHGIRFTTSEGGLHQQNGVVENAVKYVKQRARTLLHGAKLPQRLWPQAVAMAAAAQRATALGYETKLAAPFGARVLVRKREYGGSAEPGKPDDLAPRWVEGSYLGLSETVRRGHVIYVVDKETEKFIHTVHVRTDLVEPEITDIVEAELPGPPSRRLRSKAAGSGDVVSISKAQTVVSDDDLRAQTEALKDSWSQEEAENLCVQIALMLGPNEKIFGAFRHGGAVGLTKATFERQWAAEFLVKTFVMKCPDAEFTSLYVSVNSQRDLHIDSNNMMGKNNYLYPVAMPRRGGDLWVEISDGDVVRGKVTEMMDGRGVPHYGCILPLEQGHITMFNPHRRHAVRSWKGLRVVLVGYTPGVIRKLPGTDREVLSNLGFPISPEGEELIPEVAIRAFSVCPGAQRDFQKGVEEEPWADHDPSNRTCEKGESSSEEEMINDEFATLVREEEVEHWDMFLPLEQGDPNVVPKAKIASSGGVINMNKVEVTYTHNIESLLSSLSSPLAIVHTVEPKEAQDNFGKWLPAVKKELSSFDHTVTKRCARDPQVIDDIRSGRAKVVPMKIVYTVKPPNEGSSEWFRRKARIVACGNMMAASGEDNYAAAAPAEVVRSSLAISSRRGWDAGVIDITSAFLQTPLSKVDCRFRVFGQPPRALIREGLCEEHELWEFTHAVYGLRESPKWWGEFRDSTLANLVVEIEGRKVTLVRCRVESSWWKLVEDSAVIGVIVIYVDDILICSTNSVIAAVANSIKELWSTSPLAMASEGAIKFLGLEIEKIEGGFAVSQADYIAELLRIHNVKGTQRDLIPVSRETASFVATEEEAVFSEAELREAQQYAGEILWLSQRSRPDLSYAASLISSLTTKAPRRASSITRKCLGFLQRTADHRLHLVSRSQELVSWTDASFAPEGARSHTGWLIAAGDAPLSWRSSRQSTVTLSTAEAELVASVEGALALCSLYALWKEIEEEELKLILKTDSTSSIAIQHGSGSWRRRFSDFGFASIVQDTKAFSRDVKWNLTIPLRMKVLKYPMWEKLWRKNRLRPMWLVHKKEQQRRPSRTVAWLGDAARTQVGTSLGPPYRQFRLKFKGKWVVFSIDYPKWKQTTQDFSENCMKSEASQQWELQALNNLLLYVLGPKMSDVPEASTTTGAGRHEGLGVIEALAQSMRQLQELQVKALTKTDADGDSPEVVKTAVTTLPTLDSPEGDQCGLVFQDWMVQITTAMQDLSTSSGVWWESVKEVVLKAYTRWLAASPIERLGIEPAGSQDLTSGRYVRVNARSCAMVLQAIPDMGMSVPDGTVLAQGLTNLTAGAIGSVPDAMFRTQLVRATLRIDQQPSLSDVMKYQQHLQAEVENLEVEPKEEQEVPSLGANSFSSLAVSDEIYYNSGTVPKGWGNSGEVAGVPPEAKAPTLKVLAIRTDVESTDSGTGAYALVDSGATHPLRRAVDMSEWTAASPVVVHLAGGEVVQLKMNQAGTLLVPSTGTTRTASTAPIVPLGSLVGTLGYRMDWHGSRCRLVGREGDVLNLR